MAHNIFLKEIVAKLSPTSTPTPVEAEVSFNVNSSTPPTHPTTHPPVKVRIEQSSAHLIKKRLLQNVPSLYQGVQNWF